MKEDSIQLSDGKEYILSVLSVKDLLEIEKRYGTLNLAVDKIENVMFYLWLSVKKKDPITFDDFCENISMRDMSGGILNKAFEKLAEKNGWTSLKNDQAAPVVESK